MGHYQRVAGSDQGQQGLACHDDLKVSFLFGSNPDGLSLAKIKNDSED